MAQKATDGGRKPRVTDDDILAVFDGADAPVLSTAEVADALPIKRRGTLNRLRALEEQEAVASKDIGGRNTVWWRTADVGAGGRREATETPSEPPRDEPTQPREKTPRPQSEQRTEPDRPLADVVDDVAGDALPGSGAKLEARRDALRAVVAYLREHGTATPADLRREVYPDHTGGYVDGKDPARSWWKNAMYPALAELAERSDVVEKADTSGEWSYRATE